MTDLQRTGRTAAAALLAGLALAGCGAGPTELPAPVGPSLPPTQTMGATPSPIDEPQPGPSDLSPRATPAPAEPAPRSAPAGPSEPFPAPASPPTPEGAAGGSVPLPWPASTAADAAALQAAVDRGEQPWLLDPSEVAMSYAAAAHGWTDAEAYPGPDGTSVDVRNSDGDRLTLSLAQPGRTSNGIWVVTAERGG